MHWVIDVCERASSTQDVLKTLSGATEGRVVHALTQENGRGRHGRVWKFQPGNLALSLLLQPRCKMLDIGVLSLLCGVAVYQSVRFFVGNGANLKLKWPNDLLLGHKKCAGILIDTEVMQNGLIEKAYIGIGVNLLSAPDGFSSLSDCCSDVDLTEFRERLLHELGQLYPLFLDGEFDRIVQLWKSAGFNIGEKMSVKLGNQLIEGAYEGVDAKGNLLLRLGSDRVKTISSGDVFIGEPHASDN